MPSSSRAQLSPEPISHINTTPLIDVLLVLLIMMILSLPAPTHKVAVDLPVADGGPTVPPPVHRLTITGTGAYLWDGAQLESGALTAVLADFRNNPAGPVLHIETDPAVVYQRFDETIAVVKKAGIEKIGFVGNPRQF